MKFFLILLLYYLNSPQFTDSKKFRVVPNDEILTYERIDKGVPPFTEMFSIENLIFEQVDDDTVLGGGYLLWIKSMNRNLPIHVNLRTEHLYQGIWQEAPFKLFVPDMCSEYVNPGRFWYNISKLFTKCPPQKGDKWVIEEQYADIVFDLPANVPLGLWRAYFLVTQGIPGFETTKFGMGFQVEGILK